MLLIANHGDAAAQKKRGMKSIFYLFVALWGICCISCGSAGKKEVDTLSKDSIVFEDTIVYKISKFIQFKIESNKQPYIYKSPSETSPQLIEASYEDKLALYGSSVFYKWDSKPSKNETYYYPITYPLPVIEKMNDWYKVYVKTPVNTKHVYEFVGFVPCKEWKEVPLLDLSDEDYDYFPFGDDEEGLSKPIGFHKESNYYVKWGNEFGETIFFIGKNDNGKVIETNMISYGYEDTNPTHLYFMVGGEIAGGPGSMSCERIRLTNTEGISMDFQKYKKEDFEKILSLVGNRNLNIRIKQKGEYETNYYSIPLEGKVDGHKIIWDY